MLNVIAAIKRIADRESFGVEGYAVYGEIGMVEGVVHELCHWVTLGHALPRKVVKIRAETIIGRALHRATETEANANEVVTIGAELRVMGSLRIGWTAWHRDRLLAYALRGLNGELSRAMRMAYRAQMLQAASASRAQRAAGVVLNHVRREVQGRA
jgi:hypothetical protein